MKLIGQVASSMLFLPVFISVALPCSVLYAGARYFWPKE